MEKAKQCSYSDATHSITLLWSHWFKYLQPNLRVAEFLSKDNNLRDFTNGILCYICIYANIYVPVHVRFCRWCCMGCRASGWQLAGSGCHSLAPPPRREKAISFQCRADFHQRLGSIKIVNLIISEGHWTVLWLSRYYRNVFPLVNIPVPQEQLKLHGLIFYV